METQHQLTDQEVEYLALCMGGMQQYVREDIAESVPDVCLDDIKSFGSEGAGCAGSGKLIFTSKCNPADIVQNTKSIQALYSVVVKMPSGLGPLGGSNLLSKNEERRRRGKRRRQRNKDWSSIEPSSAVDNTIVETQKNGLEQLNEAVQSSSANWSAACGAWCRRFLQSSCEGENIKFRCSAMRTGKHTFRSPQVAGVVGSAAQTIHGWKTDLVHFQLEVLVLVFHDQAIVGISMQDPKNNSANGRTPPEPRLKGIDVECHDVSPVTLRPSATYVLARLAQLQAGSIVLDPMCGVGTIPLCISNWWFKSRGVVAIGGDINVPAVMFGSKALEMDPNNQASLCAWNATCLPLRSDCVDCIISDLPFGVVCGTAGRNMKVFPKAFAECLRVLKVGGRVVFLSTLVKVIRQSVKDCNFRNPDHGFSFVEEHRVNIGGIENVGLFVLQKLPKCDFMAN